MYKTELLFDEVADRIKCPVTLLYEMNFLQEMIKLRNIACELERRISRDRFEDRIGIYTRAMDAIRTGWRQIKTEEIKLEIGECVGTVTRELREKIIDVYSDSETAYMSRN